MYHVRVCWRLARLFGFAAMVLACTVETHPDWVDPTASSGTTTMPATSQNEFDGSESSTAEASTDSETSDPSETSDTGPILDEHTVFITKFAFSSDLDGLQGADDICQLAADAGGLTGTYKAILSDSIVSARYRLQIGGPISGVMGTLIAEDAQDFWDGSLAAEIRGNEDGQPTDMKRVWSGSDFNGTSLGGNCADWTTAAMGSLGTAGNNNAVDTTWFHDTERPCDELNHLYCLSQ